MTGLWMSLVGCNCGLIFIPTGGMMIRIRRGANPIGKDGTLNKTKGWKLILYHGLKSKHGPFEAMISAVLVL